MTTKKAYESKTIWGALIAALPAVLALLGVDISPEDATALVGSAEQLVTIFGVVLAIYGRVKAQAPIK